jgi:hypothetical protein
MDEFLYILIRISDYMAEKIIKRASSLSNQVQNSQKVLQVYLL